MDLVLLAGAAFLAGLIDAVVGGGGLIQLPMLFSVLPKELPATLLGTGKFAGIFGTGAAAINYSRRVRVAWSAAAPAAVAAFVLSFVGAFTVTKVPADLMRSLLPILLIAVAIYTLRKKDFGSVHAPVHGGSKERYLALGMGAGIGFYDGFFGPGTGSFLIFLYVRFFGFDFLSASAAAKIVNVACGFFGSDVVRLQRPCPLAARGNYGGVSGGWFAGRDEAGDQAGQRFRSQVISGGRLHFHPQNGLRRVFQLVLR